MARSSNVYVVVPKGCMTPTAGFTVKHELQRYLDTLAISPRVWRITDGLQDRKVTEVTDEFFV